MSQRQRSGHHPAMSHAHMMVLALAVASSTILATGSSVVGLSRPATDDPPRHDPATGSQR